MQTANPYSPPQAVVADIAEHGDHSFQPVHIFAWRGRIGRLRFLAYSTLVYVIAALLGAVAAAIAGTIHSIAPDTIISIVVYPITIGLMLMVTIQRSHDMGYSGWSSLLALIPIAGLIWVFKAGTPGANQFGAPPVPNSLGVKIVALLFPAVVVIGILAAIALPAYQNYVVRAKAAQMK